MELIISVITLIPMIISDIRTRKVNILWLIIFGATQVYFFGTENILINTLLLIFMFSGVYGYLIIRHGLKSKITNYLGLGDIIFILILTPSFDIREFIYFLIVGFILSIVWWFILKTKKTIPLVSTLCITYIIWLLMKTF